MRVVTCPNCKEDVPVHPRVKVVMKRGGIKLFDTQATTCLTCGWMSQGQLQGEQYIIDHEVGLHDEES